MLAVIDTGTANIASMLAALVRAGTEPRIVTRRDEVAAAERLVLPGVGSFAAGMERLGDLDVAGELRARVEQGRSLLCVCLGLQLLFEASDESPGVEGLGVFAGTVRRFPARANGARLCVPQLGWNRVIPTAGCSLLAEGFAYYANSYRVEALPAGCEGATSDHGGPFVAAIERGALLACQFHPELSGEWGQALVERWLARGASC